MRRAVTRSDKTSYGWEWHDSASEEMLAKLVEEAEKQYYRAFVAYGAADEALACLRAQHVSRILWSAGIKHGEKVTIAFKNKNTDAVFDYVEIRKDNPIVVRYLLKSGKPSKLKTRVSHHMAGYIKPKKK